MTKYPYSSSFLISAILILSIFCSSFNPRSSKINTSDPKQHDKEYTVNELIGKINPARQGDFVKIPLDYANRDGLYLRIEALEAFAAMHEAAKNDNINLRIISATRSFNHQKNLWERKWTGKTLVRDTNLAQHFSDYLERAKRVLLYTAMPGTSRHHWGTDIDINSLNNNYFNTGEGKRVYDWLCKNAATYGFCQTYTGFNELRTSGHEEEKWHWSYLPLSIAMYTQYIEKVNYTHLTGFKGDNIAAEAEIIEKYVKGINTLCSTEQQ